MDSQINSSIAVLGNFNPAIFQPEWFRRYKIIPEQEITEVLQKKEVASFPAGNIRIISDSFAATPGKTWIKFPSYNIQVEPHKFQINSEKKENFSNLPEITIIVFELLSHTPVNAIGMNFSGNIHIENGDKFLKELFCFKPELEKSVLTENYKAGGKFIIEKTDLIINLRVEPSSLDQNDIYIDLNFHRQINSYQTEELLGVVRNNYHKDYDEAERIAKKLLCVSENIFK